MTFNLFDCTTARRKMRQIKLCYSRGYSITGALQMGLQFSLYASSDSHDGHPGHDLSRTRAFVGHQRPFTFWWTRFDKPYPGGLTAVYGRELTRLGIFSALQNRQLYAVSDHGRPLLFLPSMASLSGEIQQQQ